LTEVVTGENLGPVQNDVDKKESKAEAEKLAKKKKECGTARVGYLSLKLERG
jgi:hypothetical protein